MNLKEFCEEINVDYTDLTGRFMGKEDLCLKFVKKFSEDVTYEELQKALEVVDYPLIERTSHTLKGIAGNLGFKKLFELSNQIVQDVRNNEYFNLSKLNEELTEEYQKIINAITKLD